MVVFESKVAESKPKIIYEDDNFSLTMEESDDVVLIHCSVMKWGMSVARKVKDVFFAFLESEQREVYAWCPDIKVFKFATMYGFRYVDTVLDLRTDTIGYLAKIGE